MSELVITKKTYQLIAKNKKGIRKKECEDRIVAASLDLCDP